MTSLPINPSRFGISFSMKQCRNFDIDAPNALDWLLAQGWRRFRLMSYWDEHEKEQGRFDFSALDWQIAAVGAAGGVVTLCLGVKQPRWPEYHWPAWAWAADKQTRDEALLRYVETVVTRYKDEDVVISWQLENEALLQGFGDRIEIDRKRLLTEYNLVKRLDPTRPIIMSTSNGWGIPVRKPRPDLIGFSFYSVMYKAGRYHATIQKPWLHRLRSSFSHILLGKYTFIHELQMEPWGPKPIWDMSKREQGKSMNPAQITASIAATTSVKAYPIDLWGSEWWYWRHLDGDDSIWNAVKSAITK